MLDTESVADVDGRRSAIAFAHESFSRIAMGDLSPDMVDLVEPIVTNAVRHGNQFEYEVVMQIYKQAPTPHHQIAAIAGLTATRDPTLLQRTMNLLFSGEVEEQNLVYLLMVRRTRRFEACWIDVI